MCWRWNMSAFRWLEFDFSLYSSIFRWPEIDFSYFRLSWSPQSFRWPGFDFSIVDNVLWTFVTAFESLALVSMLCFFFVFCGCTL